MLLYLLACGDSVKLGEDTANPSSDTDADTDADSDTDTDADSDTDSDTDADTDSDTDADTGLPDVTDWIDPDPSVCENYYGVPTAGGKSYWWGEFHGSQTDGWTGTLRWYLFANSTWEADGGADCEVAWSTSGPAVATQICDECEVGYELTAIVDRADTTCPESVWFNYQSFTYTYEMNLRETGDADWFLYGYARGAGYWAGDDVTDLNYLSTAFCTWL